jgi:hypothetical protein
MDQHSAGQGSPFSRVKDRRHPEPGVSRVKACHERSRRGTSRALPQSSTTTSLSDRIPRTADVYPAASSIAALNCSNAQVICSAVIIAGGAIKRWSPDKPSTQPCMG